MQDETAPTASKSALRKWMHILLAAAFWIALLGAFTLAVIHSPGAPGFKSDKTNHILAFAVLSLLAATAYPKASLLKIFVRLVVFGTVIELVQAIPALRRDADWRDLLADAISAAICLLLVAAVRGIRRWLTPRENHS